MLVPRITDAGGVLDTQRYQFLDRVGRGGMGEVYRGRALGFGGFEKIVAIKRLLPELATDMHYVERLVGEAKLLVSLQHSNLVSVLDLGRYGDEVFIVLEYIDGPSLHSLLRAYGGGLPLGLVSYVGQGACAGLEFAHDQPLGAVIHADLSPANVLLTRAGEIKVADFGIARREGTPQRCGVVEGKWPYMSPEQVLGEALTPASDIFSAGVVLYEMATGRLPFAGPNFGAVAARIMHGHFAPPSKHRPEIPAAFEQVCLRALARDPAERYPRMRDLAHALRAVSFSEGWRDGPDQLASLLRAHFPSRHPTDEDIADVLARLGIDEDIPPKTPVAAGATPAALTGTIVTIAERHTEVATSVTQWARPAARPATPRRSRWSWLAIAGIAVAAVAAQQLPSRGTPPAAAAVPVATPLDEPAAPTPAPAPTPTPVPVPVQPQPTVEPLPTPAPTAVRSKRSKRKRKTATTPGTVRVYSEPWAYVWVDDARERHETPVELRLAPGKHRLRLSNPETRARAHRRVSVKSGGTVTLRLELEPPP